jgi:hypothetical protein
VIRHSVRPSTHRAIEPDWFVDICCGFGAKEDVMANPKLRFYFREPTIDTNLPITDGTVKIDGFDWEFVA